MAFYCKNCKKETRILDTWYLLPNLQFENRIAIVGKCSRCKKDIILLSETRKKDGKIFNQLEVGKKAEHIAKLVLNDIDYTLEDIKDKSEKPEIKWNYGKAVKDIKEKCYKIFRVDFHNRKELIGTMPIDGTTQKIRDIEKNKIKCSLMN